MIYIGSDHGGYKLKEKIKKMLTSEKLDFVDVGPNKYDKNDDYPDYAAKVARHISKNPLKHLGILICRSGQGVCIVANKFQNVRAALVWNTEEAKVSRNDDMTNILCLPADYVSPIIAERIVDVWLQTPYSTDNRHIRRIKKISDTENKSCQYL